MENLKKLKELITRFDKDIELLNKLDTYDEIDHMERQLVQELQALQSILDTAVYRDLYIVVKQARKNLENRPLIVDKEEDVANSESNAKTSNARTSKPKTTRKTKRAAK